MRKSLLCVTASIFLIGATHAQEVAYRINNYSIHQGFKNSDFPIHGAEIGYLKNLNKVLDLYIPLRLGPRGDVKKTVNSETVKTNMMGTFAIDVALQAKYDNGHNFLVPFISAGVGTEWYDSGLELGAPVGGGLNFRVTPKLFITAATNYRFSMTETSPEGFCHSLGIIVNLKGKKGENEKPFISKMPEKKTEVNEEYARLEAEARAKKEAELAEAAAKAKKEAEAAAKANAEALAQREAQIATEKAKEEEARRAKMQATVPVEVSTEVKKVLDFALKGVQFETGSAQLTQSSFAILDDVASTMLTNPSLRISIEGHTDRTGNESINMKLSEARAKACATYLISKGVSSDRLKESGFGSTRPVSNNDTPDSRSLNRRVEFIPF